MTHHKPSATRRERRITARKNQILDAAIALFAEKGYHRTTTKDIAVAADISEGTIYNYFDSKEDLLIGIMSRLANPNDIEEIPAGVQEDSREYLIAIVENRLAFIHENYPTLRAVLSEILVNPEMAGRYYNQIVFPVQAQLEENLKQRVDRGQIRAIEPALAARLVVAAILGSFFLDSMGDPIAYAPKNFGNLLIDILFDGIRPVEGRS
jgi:AcrR family transcriptional regulator